MLQELLGEWGCPWSLPGETMVGQGQCERVGSTRDQGSDHTARLTKICKVLQHTQLLATMFSAVDFQTVM